MKYLAVKVKDVDFWMWFETAKVYEDGNLFSAEDGWGKNGAKINVNLDKRDIIGRIESDTLQY